ncbi:SIS domain-containing protein [Nocardiopsis sp. HNM0947]|uniref:SIS domain-containing protein n=1 Tax=Nocardiopsis coralli TaxID=2772213 RepID=A0ABR9P9Y9_9ACTN|nr:SIS domain-containing protein [Nocardiopsis coralli]MBE3000651.1 SIS domain-containing protein [Nocardiopsis coralli]
MSGRHMLEELRSQPAVWNRVLSEALPEHAGVLPRHGERVQVLGCGSSWFMAQAYAAAREQEGLGETDAFTPTEAPLSRGYDSVVLISRSGTTSEVLDVLRRLPTGVPTVAIVGDPDSALARHATHAVRLPFADEHSVVQTRFATSALVLLLGSLGADRFGLDRAVVDTRDLLAELELDDATGTGPLGKPLDEQLLASEQFTFLGSGWCLGLAHEAALKMRESCQAWTESYPSMEYRHGPIAIAGPGRVTWQFGGAPPGLAEQVGTAGARFEASDRHPLAELVRLHAAALTRARRHGLDPDHPRSLSRAVVLDDESL